MNRSTPKPSGLRELTEQILAQESRLREGGGDAGRQRQKKLNRLTARERIDSLLDDNHTFLELNLWAAHGMYEEWGEVPAAGVVTGIGAIAGRDCMVIANDATVKAGAFFPQTAKKVLRAQRIAAACNLPLVYLVDSAGVFLPMQDEIFPDEDDFGRIFRNNAVFSAMGIPQIAAIMGNCVAGGAYLPVLCDKLLMTEGSALYLAGPALVKAAIGQQVDEEELGGAGMHALTSGTVDFREKDDPACIRRLRELIGLIPEVPGPALDGKSSGPVRDPDELYGLFGGEYDAHNLLACIADADSIHEYKAEYGRTLLCAYARLGGRPVGIVANQHIRVQSRDKGIQLGGVIYGDSAEKAARFVMDCDQNRLPIVFFQDVQGFMVGRDAEQSGIIRSGAKLVNAVSNVTVPKITVVIGGSFGAGNYALCGKAFDPVFLFAWPGARYAVMGGAQAAQTLLSLEERKARSAGRLLDDAARRKLRDTIKERYDSQTDIRYGAARGWIDAIIPPHTTRDVLIRALRYATRPNPAGGFRSGVFQV
jgi:3-methylcrotonyl-CoA carboxylase beta subunit